MRMSLSSSAVVRTWLGLGLGLGRVRVGVRVRIRVRVRVRVKVRVRFSPSAVVRTVGKGQSGAAISLRCSASHPRPAKKGWALSSSIPRPPHPIRPLRSTVSSLVRDGVRVRVRARADPLAPAAAMRHRHRPMAGEASGERCARRRLPRPACLRRRCKWRGRLAASPQRERPTPTNRRRYRNPPARPRETARGLDWCEHAWRANDGVQVAALHGAVRTQHLGQPLGRAEVS
eukprot:scaffold55253_cov61-Phaeocystis_antarctica.AAC.27